MRDADLRPAAVAGRFYAAEPAALAAEARRFLGDVTRAEPRLGVLAPHAGFLYSGGVAGKVYAATRVPDRVIVMAPNHTGRGARRAVWARGALAFPGGAVAVDEELAEALVGRAGLVDDREAHRLEHAVEVQLPFLVARNPDARVVPIVLGPLDHAECARVAEALAAATADRDVLVVASSDMNHYLPDEVTRARDRRCLAPLLALDGAALHDTVVREDHSMCGFVPATVMLTWAKARARTAELHAYATSGDAFGDRDAVVGYAGASIS